MPNNIALFQKYIDVLDEVYKEAAKTAVLDSDATLARAGANTNEIVIPKLSMDGLANYSRNSGFVGGSVEMVYETVKFNFDRGRSFTVDAMDNEETAGIAFGKLASEFIRTKVVPELDAFRFAAYASTEGISSASGALSSGANAVTALRAATSKMDEDEVPMERRILFITPTLKGMVEDLDTTKSREVMARFSQVIVVPQSRFYTGVKLHDGVTGGEEAGGFAKGADGKNINFLVVSPDALMQYSKHTVSKIVTPEANQDADAWKFMFRSYGLADVYENKVAGIYLHAAAE